MRAAQLAMPLLRHLLPTLYMTQWRPLMLQHVQTMPASCSASTAFALLQRRRNTEDELNMRAVYQEGDLISVSLCSASAVPQVTALPHKSSSKQAALPMLIQHDATVTPPKARWRLSQAWSGRRPIVGLSCPSQLSPALRRPPCMQAEIQSFYADGSIALHTRSTKYGKVGFMAAPPAALCCRTPGFASALQCPCTVWECSSLAHLRMRCCSCSEPAVSCWAQAGCQLPVCIAELHLC